MSVQFRPRKKLKVEILVPGETDVNEGDLQDFFSRKTGQAVIATVEANTYFSEIESESSSETPGSTQSERAYQRLARNCVDSQADEESVSQSRRWDRNECWPCTASGRIRWDLLDTSASVDNGGTESDGYGEVRSDGETLGTEDSSLSEYSEDSDLSFISHSESVVEVENVQRFIRQNDAQELRLLESAKRAIDRCNDPWASIRGDNKRTKYE